MAGSNHLIVVDGEYKFANYKIKAYGEQLVLASRYYVKILRFILSDGVKDQLLAEGFDELLAQVEKLPDQIDMIQAAAAQKCLDFQSEIDDADMFQ